MTIRTSYFPLSGGLNTEAPPLATGAGELIDCANYEALMGGGYRRINGYTLFDGQAIPAQAVPGSGSVLGIHIYKGEVYAIREDGTNGRLYKATTSGWVEVDNLFTWSTGGEYYFANYNFYGQDDQEEMFIVNGVNKAVKFDGTSLVQVTTGTGNDNPSFVIGHKKHLMLAIESSLVVSAIGNPLDYQAINGAVEIAVGDTISQMVSATSALIIGCVDSTHVLYGSSAQDFNLDQFNNLGTYRGSLAQIGGMVIGLDRQGLMSLTAANQYGNFAYVSLSNKISNLARAFTVSARAMIRRSSSQFRVFEGKTGLYFTFNGVNLIGVTRVSFPNAVICVANGVDSQRNELCLFGSDNGNVYLLDNGFTFAGEQIYSYLVTSFHHYGGPTSNKRFRLVQPDLRIEGDPATINIRATVDYGSGNISRGIVNDLMETQYITEDLARTIVSNLLASGGGPWDFATWDSFFYDAVYHEDVKTRVSLTGTNMAVMISADGSTNSIHTIFGVTVHYSPRRLIR